MSPTLSGYFARFNEPTTIDSPQEGTFVESIKRGAFARTLAEGGQRVLLEHGHDPGVGNRPISIPETMYEDERGAYFEGPLLPGVPALVESGLRAGVYGASFRFRVRRDSWVERPGVSASNPRGLPQRTLLEIEVPEFGPVTFPAYKGATASVRSEQRPSVPGVRSAARAAVSTRRAELDELGAILSDLKQREERANA